MFTVAFTTNGIYTINPSTRTLTDSNGNILAYGWLRIWAVMFNKDIIAVKNFDYNGNCTYSKTRRAYA